MTHTPEDLRVLVATGRGHLRHDPCYTCSGPVVLLPESVVCACGERPYDRLQDALDHAAVEAHDYDTMVGAT